MSSRYTELMSKDYKKLTTKEKIELMKLILEEYDREERRINKLPVDSQTKRECLWNVINAHSNFLDDLIFTFANNESKFNQTDHKRISRLQDSYIRLKKNKRYIEEENVKVEENDKVEGNDAKDTSRLAKDAKKNLILRNEIANNLSSLKTKYGHLLANKEGEEVTNKSVYEASNTLSMEKAEYKYSLAGDTTITDAQRKALYQFHHWMRKHNGTAGLKWAGFGYKGSTVDFSERFMRLPARVQLKALYLVESDRRKNPIEDIDNEISQDYVPNYDKLKGKMTSSFVFARKYLNKSRYLWSKLEQAANIANKKETVEKLKSYTDAVLNKKKKNEFFRDNDSENDIIKNIIREKEQLKIALHKNNLAEETKKQIKNDLKEKREALKDIKNTIHNADKAEEIIKKYENTDKKPSWYDKKKLKSYLKDIEAVKEKYQKNDSLLKKYKHVFFKQTNDLAGYTATGTGFGVNMFNASHSESAHAGYNATAAILTFPSAIANFVNDLRSVVYGESKWEKSIAGLNMLGDVGWATSKALTAYTWKAKLEGAAKMTSKVASTTGFGVGFVINAAKTIKSGSESKTSGKINKDFEVLRKNLNREIKALKDKENRTDKENKKLAKLTNVKQTASWSTLEKASKLINRDKKREHHASLRRLLGSTVGLAGNVCGYLSEINPMVFDNANYAGGPGSTVIGVLSDMRDNVVARNRNREYIEAEYPITDSDRIAAIMNYEKQLENCEDGSDEYKEIKDILSSREKLDNRIRNLKAGQHVRANQEGLKNEIYSGYTKTISEQAKIYKDNEDTFNGVIKSDGEVEAIDERYIEVEKSADRDLINTNINTDINTNINTDINTDINTNSKIDINTNVNNNLDNKDEALDDENEVDYEQEARKLMVRYSDLLDLNKTDKKKTDKKKTDKKVKKDKNDIGRPSIESNRSSISSERESLNSKK